MKLKNFLSRWSAESRVFLSRCISRERSEDTLQRLLEKVNRVPLHEDFHFRVTNGQRAEVKRALHCEGISLISASDPSLRIYMPSKRIITTNTNLHLKASAPDKFPQQRISRYTFASDSYKIIKKLQQSLCFQIFLRIFIYCKEKRFYILLKDCEFIA